MMPMVSTQTQERSITITCLASTNKHHWTPKVLRPSHIHQSLHPWFVHLDCPSVWAAQERHRLHLELHLQCRFSIRSKKLSSVTPPSDISTHHFPVTIQVDASQVGLGAALLQNGKPVAFASKTLTKTDMLVCQHRERDASCSSLEWRDSKHMSMVGFSPLSQTTKPLESITQKNLADTPAHLQCMLLHLQGYNYYHPLLPR